MPLARSRYRGGIGSMGRVEMGQGTFSQTPAPSCPPGQHWEAPAATAVRGIGACVPDAISIRPLTFRAPQAQIAPPPAPPITQAIVPLTLPPQAYAAPSGGDAAAAPVPTTTTTCPALWPWWWILVAGIVGFGGGYYAEQNQKKVKRNAGRYANRIVNRAGDMAIARLLG